jgi:hypothetical protein
LRAAEGGGGCSLTLGPVVYRRARYRWGWVRFYSHHITIVRRLDASLCRSEIVRASRLIRRPYPLCDKGASARTCVAIIIFVNALVSITF